MVPRPRGFVGMTMLRHIVDCSEPKGLLEHGLADFQQGCSRWPGQSFRDRAVGAGQFLGAEQRVDGDRGPWKTFSPRRPVGDCRIAGIKRSRHTTSRSGLPHPPASIAKFLTRLVVSRPLRDRVQASGSHPGCMMRLSGGGRGDALRGRGGFRTSPRCRNFCANPGIRK